MFATSGRRHVRGTAPVVDVRAVEGVGANVQGRTEGAWSRTSGPMGHLCSTRETLRQVVSGGSQGSESGKQKCPFH